MGLTAPEETWRQVRIPTSHVGRLISVSTHFFGRPFGRALGTIWHCHLSVWR